MEETSRSQQGGFLEAPPPTHPHLSSQKQSRQTDKREQEEKAGDCLPLSGALQPRQGWIQVPEEQHEGPKETPEVVVPVDVTLLI